MQNDKAPERIWYQIGYSPGNILDIKPWDENSVEYIRADLVEQIKEQAIWDFMVKQKEKPKT